MGEDSGAGRGPQCKQQLGKHELASTTFPLKQKCPKNSHAQKGPSCFYSKMGYLDDSEFPQIVPSSKSNYARSWKETKAAASFCKQRGSSTFQIMGRGCEAIPIFRALLLYPMDTRKQNLVPPGLICRHHPPNTLPGGARPLSRAPYLLT